MKKKRFDKKLSLNKTTLADLDYAKMREAHGGLVETNDGWNTIDKRCAIYSCGDACSWLPVCEGTFYFC
jgi:hypothetical protein